MSTDKLKSLESKRAANYTPLTLANVVALIAALILGVTTMSGDRVFAQNPPQPTPVAPIAPPSQPQVAICDQAGAQNAIAGSTLRFGEIAVVLPLGHGSFDVRFVPIEPGPNVINICYLAGHSAIVINASTGAEIKREVTDPNANALLDEILKGVGRNVASQITVPSTGNAGLRH